MLAQSIVIAMALKLALNEGAVNVFFKYISVLRLTVMTKTVFESSLYCTNSELNEAYQI